MTNKSRLQANNENLQSLIDKANQLPDAGGGGGSAETCYIEINCDAPARDACTATYTNSSMGQATKTFAIMEGTRIEVTKGTIIALSPWTNTSQCSGGCTEIFSHMNGGVYFISDEGTVTYA